MRARGMRSAGRPARSRAGCPELPLRARCAFAGCAPARLPLEDGPAFSEGVSSGMRSGVSASLVGVALLSLTACSSGPGSQSSWTASPASAQAPPARVVQWLGEYDADDGGPV